jgi:cytidylate kinase
MAIITISRGTFSGGKALAERLAERLDYPCLSREDVISDAAKVYRISEEDLASAIGEPPPFWQEVPGKRIAYLKCVTAALLDHAKEGNLVYHGYAGHLLLGGISHLIRVRVIADMGFRINAAMEQMNLGRDEAILYIEKVDKDRTKWTRFLYGVEWGDPALYDVVLNLERMSVESACETIVNMTNLHDFEATPGSEKAFDDLVLSTRVWASLAKSDRTKTAYVKVVADDGRVTISGNAGSEKVLDAIPEVAREVDGVTKVISEVGIGSDWYW